MIGVWTPNLEHQKRPLYPLHHTPPGYIKGQMIKLGFQSGGCNVQSQPGINWMQPSPNTSRATLVYQNTATMLLSTICVRQSLSQSTWRTEFKKVFQYSATQRNSMESNSHFCKMIFFSSVSTEVCNNYEREARWCYDISLWIQQRWFISFRFVYYFSRQQIEKKR